MTDISSIAETSDESLQASEAIRNIANDLGPAAKGLAPLVRRVTDEVCTITGRRRSNR